MMDFDEALYNFINALVAESGAEMPVTKIGLDPRVFEQMIYKLSQKSDYRNIASLETLASGGVRIFGVEIVSRPPEKF